jgi:glutamate synthase domain-containing protein 3
VRALVEEHLRRTGSPVAGRVLQHWEQLLRSFVKVFPTDYKRVLAEQAAEERFEPAASTGGDGFVGEEAVA